MDLRTARQDKGLTQEQLADLCGLPQTTISDIERAVIKKPSWDAVRKICRVLDVQPDDIFPVEDMPRTA